MLVARKGLLERAANFLRVATSEVGERQLALPTPCAGWDLRMLIVHVDESVSALIEALGSRFLRPLPGPAPSAEVALGSLRQRTRELLETWVATGADDDCGTVAVGRHRLASTAIANTGALELTVHAWDIAHACRLPDTIPPALASDLLEIAELVVPDRGGPEFGPRVRLSPSAAPGDRLVAMLGRDPSRR